MSKKARARNSRGRFVKSSKSTALARRGSTSVARRGSTAVARRSTSAPVKRGKRRHGGGGGGGIIGTGVNAVIPTLKAWTPELMGAAGYGFIDRAPAVNAKGEASLASKLREQIEKLPTIAAIGKHGSRGGFFLLGGAFASGKIRRVLALLSKAAMFKAADNVGASAFDLEAAAKMAGDDDDEDSLSGDVDDRG